MPVQGKRNPCPRGSAPIRVRLGLTGDWDHCASLVNVETIPLRVSSPATGNPVYSRFRGCRFLKNYQDRVFSPIVKFRKGIDGLAFNLETSTTFESRHG